MIPRTSTLWGILFCVTAKTKASFIPPMLLVRTEKLPEGNDWLYEILCGRPHKISSVAFAVMWRWHAGLVMKTHGTAAEAT
jgi:hypothetical protein